MSGPIELRFRAVGRDALLVVVDDLAAATTLHAWIRSTSELPRPRDVVPGARSVLLDGVDPDAWRDVMSRQRIAAARPADGQEVVVPIRYDGADLHEVADSWGCSPSEVVARHSSTPFVVAFCGFAPGFAYCTSGGRLPEVPRRAEPRPRVPAGSIALAGEFCGLYPNEMPGGWQLIGRTDERLFDPDRAEPALLRPGDRVRFEVRT